MITIWIWEKTGITVVSRWAKVAKKSPDKKAFVMEDRSITFKEVNLKSNLFFYVDHRPSSRNGVTIDCERDICEFDPQFGD